MPPPAMASALLGHAPRALVMHYFSKEGGWRLIHASSCKHKRPPLACASRPRRALFFKGRGSTFNPRLLLQVQAPSSGIRLVPLSRVVFQKKGNDTQSMPPPTSTNALVGHAPSALVTHYFAPSYVCKCYAVASLGATLGCVHKLKDMAQKGGQYQVPCNTTNRNDHTKAMITCSKLLYRNLAPTCRPP